MVRTRSAAWRPGVAAVVVGGVLLVAGCASGGGETDLQRAQAQVTAKQSALTEAQDEAADTADAFCSAGVDYVDALDRYGDVLTADAPTVGDVVTAGTDLREPKADALEAGTSAQTAHQAVADAQTDLDHANAELAAIQAASPSGTPTPVPEPTTTPVSLAPADVVARVQQADAELTAAQKGITDDTPLKQASQQFNAAAVALEMSWLQLLASAGCLDDEQLAQAQAAVAAYTSALQQSLTDAGYYSGAVDGVYGPATVAAVEAVQKAHALPVTGTVDKATDAALQSDLQAKGGAVAQSALVSTTALQQTLHLAGYWDGPIDGQWTPELTAALTKLQTDLGVPATGVVDAATVAAFEAALAAHPEPAPSPEPSGSATS
jgi:murein L,D-transpeptidase YcbB/YkuD